MKNKISLSIIVPAYNEEKNIQSAVTGILSAIKNTVPDYEIIIVNDGSTDHTASVSLKLAKKNKKIRVINRSENRGFGFTFREGVENAKKEYITTFHGDNDASPTFLRELLNSAKERDLVITYPVYMIQRSLTRRILSEIFTVLMNFLFRLKLKYYNGTFICKTEVLSKVNLASKGFAIYAEAKVRLLKRGYSVKEISFEHVGRKFGYSKNVNSRSFFQALQTLAHLLWDVYVLHL